jgi:hypothetical protein
MVGKGHDGVLAAHRRDAVQVSARIRRRLRFHDSQSWKIPRRRRSEALPRLAIEDTDGRSGVSACLCMANYQIRIISWFSGGCMMMPCVNASKRPSHRFSRRMCSSNARPMDLTLEDDSVTDIFSRAVPTDILHFCVRVVVTRQQTLFRAISTGIPHFCTRVLVVQVTRAARAGRATLIPDTLLPISRATCGRRSSGFAARRMGRRGVPRWSQRWLRGRDD